MFKVGDKVVITKIENQFWKDEFILNKVYTIERFNTFNNKLVYFEENYHNFDMSRGHLVSETVYNSSLFKIMNEVEND